MSDKELRDQNLPRERFSRRAREVVRSRPGWIRSGASDSGLALPVHADLLVRLQEGIHGPMGGLLRALDELTEDDLDPSLIAASTAARNQAGRVLSVVTDFIDLAWLQAGTMTLEHVPFDLEALVDSVLEQVRREVNDVAGRLQAARGETVPRQIRGDPGRLRQVLQYLLQSACASAERGPISLSVTLDGGTDPYLRFDIGGGACPAGWAADLAGGDGISSDGSGRELHATLCLGVAALMGGTVEVHPDCADLVSFRFPLTPIESPTMRAPDRTPIQFVGKAALVVSDTVTSRARLVDTLRGVGIKVSAVESEDQAVNLLDVARCVYDVVILDIAASSRESFDLARRLASRGRLPRPQLMLLTSGGQRGDAQRCREAGIGAYLTRPTTRPQILEALAALLAETDGSLPANDVPLVTRHSMVEKRPQLRVLLVEDNRVSQAVAATILRKRGHEVVVVDEGAKAIAAVQATAFDVALIDVCLPGMDGIETARAIRNLPHGQGLPMVAVTASVAEYERTHRLSSQFERVMAKPFLPHELFAAVEGWGELPPENPASQAVLTAEGPVDLASLRRTMQEGGAADAVDALLNVFMDDAPARLDGLSVAVETGDREQIAAAAHVYKSAASTIRAKQLAALLGAMEESARRDDVPHTKTVFGDVKREHDAVLLQLGAGVRVG